MNSTFQEMDVKGVSCKRCGPKVGQKWIFIYISFFVNFFCWKNHCLRYYMPVYFWGNLRTIIHQKNPLSKRGLKF